LAHLQQRSEGLCLLPEACGPPSNQRNGHRELARRCSEIFTKLLDTELDGTRGFLQASGCKGNLGPSGRRIKVWGFASWEALVGAASLAFGPGTDHPHFHSPDLPVVSALVLAGDFDATVAPSYYLCWLRREMNRVRDEKARLELRKANAAGFKPSKWSKGNRNPAAVERLERRERIEHERKVKERDDEIKALERRMREFNTMDKPGAEQQQQQQQQDAPPAGTLLCAHIASHDLHTFATDGRFFFLHAISPQRRRPPSLPHPHPRSLRPPLRRLRRAASGSAGRPTG